MLILHFLQTALCSKYCIKAKVLVVEQRSHYKLCEVERSHYDVVKWNNNAEFMVEHQLQALVLEPLSEITVGVCFVMTPLCHGWNGSLPLVKWLTAFRYSGGPEPLCTIMQYPELGFWVIEKCLHVSNTRSRHGCLLFSQSKHSNYRRCQSLSEVASVISPAHWAQDIRHERIWRELNPPPAPHLLFIWWDWRRLCAAGCCNISSRRRGIFLLMQELSAFFFCSS